MIKQFAKNVEVRKGEGEGANRMIKADMDWSLSNKVELKSKFSLFANFKERKRRREIIHVLIKLHTKSEGKKGRRKVMKRLVESC